MEVDKGLDNIARRQDYESESTKISLDIKEFHKNTTEEH